MLFRSSWCRVPSRTSRKCACWNGTESRAGAFAGGELIVELETHKAVVEVRAAQHGILRRILCEPGTWAKPGEPLAVLSDATSDALPEDAGQLPALAVEFEIT